MQETWVQSLDLEDPLEKGTPEEFYGLYSPWGCKELDTTEQLSFSHVGHSISIPSTLLYSSAHDLNKVNKIMGFLPCLSPLNHDAFTLSF